MSDHTKEPWVIRNGCIFSDQRMHAIVVLGTNKVDTANAKRIGACVNALAGIPNSALEEGVVREMIEMLKRIDKSGGYVVDIDDLEQLLAKLEAE